jgi:uncharacterized protein involved in exopolysaccharide biosynthesis
LKIDRSAYQRGMREALSTLFRHKWGIVIVTLLVIAGAVTMALFLPAIYDSEAKILVKFGRETLIVDPAASIAGPRTGSGGTSLMQQVHTQEQILTSHYLAEQVVDQLGPESFAPQDRGGMSGLTAGQDSTDEAALTARDRAIRQFMDNLSARAAEDTSLINVVYESTDPNLAHDALNALLNLYLDQHVKIHAFEASPEFFQAQTDTARKRLLEKEQTLSRFREDNGLADDLAAQQQALNEQIAALKTDVADARTEAEFTRVRVAGLERALENRTPVTELTRTTGQINATLEALKDQKVSIARELEELRELYPEGHRLINVAESQLEVIEGAIHRENPTLTTVTTGVDQNYETLRYELDMERTRATSAQARREIMEQELAARQKEFRDLIAVAAQMEDLQREVKLLQEEYLDYRETLHRAEVNKALDRDKVTSVRIVQAATLPLTPVRPNKVQLVLLGCVLGVAGGLGYAFMRDFLDTSLKTSEDVVQHLAVPVLASITRRDFLSCT